jgi:hypothetical protein
MLVSQGLTIDFTGSDEADRTELHGNPDYDAAVGGVPARACVKF